MRFLATTTLLMGLLCLLPAASAEGWRSSGPWGGSATSIWVSPDQPSTVLAGSRNSIIFRSLDAGRTWSRLPFPRHFLGTVAAVASIPGDPKSYIAGLSLPSSPFAGVWYSQDAGATWKQAEGLAGISVEALAFWPRDPRRMVAGTRDGVWTSSNSGRSWTRISAPYNHELRGVTAVAIDPADSNIVYAGTTHLPWKTTDGGKNWSSIHDGMIDDSDVFSIFIDPSSPDSVFASACSGIYKSETAGAAWTKFQGIPASHRRTHVVRLHPSKRGVIYAGTTLGLLKSTNGGATFRQMNQLHILAMSFDPSNPETFYLATEGAGIWKSTDGGVTAEPINEGFVSRRAASLAASNGDLYLNVMQDGLSGGIFSSSDGGREWQLTANSAVLRDNHVSQLAGCPTDAGLIFAGNDTHVLRSSDGGKKWSEISLGGKTPPRLSSLACVQQDGGKQAVFAGTDRGLLKSLDLGRTWQPVRLTAVNIPHNVQAIYPTPLSPTRLCVRTTQAVYLSDDAGTSWRALSILFPVSAIYDMALAGGPNGPFLAATPQGLYGSDDGGKTWQRRTNGLAPGTVSTLAVRPGNSGEVYAAQFGKVYRSTNGGKDWLPIREAEIPEATLRKLAFHPADSSRLLALTPDLGVFYLDLSDDR
jgi:photosystem II stability/assembly factor-like uncharacterized protein